ncbi:universal stress protein [Aeromonas caviae]
MKNENKVLACVDQSRYAVHVADCAAWAARRIDAPLELLHVIDSHPERATDDDHSGAIGIDAQERLLAHLSAEDEAHAKSAREQGRLFLNRLRERAILAGAARVDVRQRHGSLEDTLIEQAQGLRLLALGRRGKGARTHENELGHHVENIIRALKLPILTVSEEFKPPERVMIAFDGGTAIRRGMEMLSSSPLLRGLPIRILMSGNQFGGQAKSLEWAKQTLSRASSEVTASLVPGDAGAVVEKAVKEQEIDLLIMGAFSHSPLRALLFGSKTAELLRSSHIPILLLR